MSGIRCRRATQRSQRCGTRRAAATLAMVSFVGLWPGCGVTPGGKAAEDTEAFSIRSLPDVLLDTSVRVSARRYLTGSVPVAVSTNTFDQAQRVEAFVEQATEFHDCYVSRPRMDWVAFGENGNRALSADLLAAVNLSRERGVDCVLIEIDPVSDRREVGLLPPELQGMNFGNREVSEPVKRMALEIAVKIRPTYMSIGVEMNGYYEAHPDDYLNYVALHKETYDAVKAETPEVKFYGSFNLEGMQGFFGDLDEFSNHGPQWFLIDMLEPKLDAVGFSTLPFPLFVRPVLIPDDYLSRIELHTARDILFTEIGWPGSPDVPAHTPQSQAEYVAEMIRLVDRMSQVRMVVWTTLFDPDLGTPLDLHPDFAALGLIDTAGTPKPALQVWEQLHALPYEPG